MKASGGATSISTGDYEAIYRSIVRRMGGKMGRCVRFSPGMRVLRQDPFEALISFILSQNNNVPRIKGIVRRLCRFGEHLGEEDYAFPTPERIVSLSAEELSTLRCGWRDAYIQDAARRVAEGTLDLGRVAPFLLGRGAAGAADGSGDRPKGGRLRTVIWIGAARRLSSRRVDETRHGVPVSRESTRRFRTVCRNRTAGDFSLLPLPSAGGTVNYGRFSQEFNKTAGQVVR